MTNLQGNWTAVAFNSITFTKVQDVKFSQGGKVDLYSADLDRFNTVATTFMTAPTASITSGNMAQFMNSATMSPGTTSTLDATHKDAKLVTGGDILYVLANAIFESADSNGPHGSWGTGSANFVSISSDGTTNPFTLTRA